MHPKNKQRLNLESLTLAKCYLPAPHLANDTDNFCTGSTPRWMPFDWVKQHQTPSSTTEEIRLEVLHPSSPNTGRESRSQSAPPPPPAPCSYFHLLPTGLSSLLEAVPEVCPLLLPPVGFRFIGFVGDCVWCLEHLPHTCSNTSFLPCFIHYPTIRLLPFSKRSTDIFLDVERLKNEERKG